MTHDVAPCVCGHDYIDHKEETRRTATTDVINLIFGQCQHEYCTCPRYKRA